MDYEDRLRKAGKEEIEASLRYARLADDAEETGDYSSAQQIRIMADQELEHSRMIERMLASLPTFRGDPGAASINYRGIYLEPTDGVVQVWHDDKWLDFASIKDQSDADYAEKLVSGTHPQYKGEYRIKARNKDTGQMEDISTGRPSILQERAKEVLGRISEPLSRPFPKTYGDWVDLAEDIKEKLPDDPATRACVNFQLQHIADREDEGEAKRWLMQEAGRLGIR